MAQQQAIERVMIIVPDADERAFLVEAALQPFGYDVLQTGNGNEALSMIYEGTPPDVIVMDMTPEGLQGTDIITGLNSSQFDIPVIVIADEGGEREALKAFRLGAKDYIARPIRETELIQVVERAMKDVRLRREREGLLAQVQQSARAAEQRLREIKTLMSIGKAVTAVTNLNQVFDHVTRAAQQVTRGESVGILLRDDETGDLRLRAGQDLARELQEKVGEPVEDDLASMVMNSRETTVMGGEGLHRFRPIQAGANSVIYAPMVVHESAIGLLWVANRHAEFEPYMVPLLTALADYAAIAVVNARLFTTMQERTRQMEVVNQRLQEQMSQSDRLDKLPVFTASMRVPLEQIANNMQLFRSGEMGDLTIQQQASVDVMMRQLDNMRKQIDRFSPPSDD